jgi:hypothetical protein
VGGAQQHLFPLPQVFASPVTASTLVSRREHCDDCDHFHRLAFANGEEGFAYLCRYGQMAYDRSDDSRRGRGSRALQRSLASGAFQHGHIRADEHRVTMWYVFNVHALFHAYHVTRTCVRDQRLTHYLNRSMVKIFPYLTLNKGIRYCWPTSFKVLRVLFLGEVDTAFLPSKKAC